ncbi:hypothetical protein N7507_006785 [Penicillium longicatenatum]|nr:hypothetical protein N7507_006785 [Penicillium longicatenatum]
MSSNSNQHPSSLGDHNPQSSSNTHLDPNNGYSASDNQLAGLVEAATAAADQDPDLSHWAAAAATAVSHQQLDSYGTDMHLAEDGFGDANFGTTMGSGRHLRVPNDHSQSPGLSRTVSKKRKRNDDNLDPALAGAGLSGAQPHAQASQQGSHGYAGDNMDIRSVPPQSLNEARAVGVHSAAALFRQPSSNKKYTRPPMSKLFASLELSPENFLHLQAAAKGYMLNDEYPERRDCVGQRGKGDTEMVKLRLWNCVRHFLEAEGNGDRFFGENVVNEGMGPRTYIWPRDQQKIISLVIPLLRRMVTNERQRQYAIETRKGGGADDRRRRQTNESFQDMNGPRFSPEQSLQLQNQDHRPGDMEQTMPTAPPVQIHHDSLDPSNVMDLGLTDLFLDGYTFDYHDFAKSYDMYNQQFELDNLFSLSGLQQPEFRGLVAAVDSHYRVIHDGEPCPSPCEDANVHRIIHSDSVANLNWRIGGGRNTTARDDFASSITRDVSRIIGEKVSRQTPSAAHNHAPMADTKFHPQPPAPIQNATNVTPSNPNNQTYLCINVIQQGKRILPRIDLPADQLPTVDSAKQAILRRYLGQIPGLPFLQGQDNDDSVDQQARNAALAAWKVKVWLPDGLIPVDNDKDWTFALLSADTVDWMDGNLKVLVDIDGNNAH